MVKRKNSREAILDAAEAVVAESGAGHLSLDIVAQKAGVSKGGLMYNFPTKKALLTAMIDRLMLQFYIDRDIKKKTLGKGRAALLKAGILSQLESNERRDRMGSAILAVAANDPDLLETLRRAHREHLKELADSGIKFERAAILSLAADGLMLNELLRLSPFSPEQRNKIKKEIIQIIDEEIKSGK